MLQDAHVNSFIRIDYTSSYGIQVNLKSDRYQKQFLQKSLKV
jgi:hypothetical protein